jgi:hypothetical protein
MSDVEDREPGARRGGAEAEGGGTPWKQPPLVKVYEAFSAVADGRVSIVAPGEAVVVSSNGARTYAVSWSDDGAAIVADDNGSRWQGYAGYPIVAVLLVLGTLKADEALMAPLAGVDWHELNERSRRRYDEAVAAVLAAAESGGADASAIAAAAEDVARQLAALALRRLRRGRRP